VLNFKAYWPLTKKVIIPYSHGPTPPYQLLILAIELKGFGTGVPLLSVNVKLILVTYTFCSSGRYS